MTKIFFYYLGRFDKYERNIHRNYETISTDFNVGTNCRRHRFYAGSLEPSRTMAGEPSISERGSATRWVNQDGTPSLECDQNNLDKEKIMGLKIEKLMVAMAEHEGWHAVGSPENQLGSRSYRHHNPGNLRLSPFACATVDGFAVFKNDALGWLAFQYDLLQKSKGNTVTKLGPKSTLRDLIFTWAPPSDGNDSEAYLASVCRNSGLPETITLEDIFK